MPEATSNIEFAHKIHESGHRGGGSRSHREQWLEIFEAIVLAAVAVLTAWSGYQAAKWDAKSAAAYSLASRTTVRAQEQLTLAGQDRLYDISTFNAWIGARLKSDQKLMEILERRFRPEYTAAFVAWMKTNPIENANAPAGPIFMAEYKSARADQARELGEEAQRYFEQGVATRETGDNYVRITVILATVLLLTALSQRFGMMAPRVGLLAVAAVMLAFAVYFIASFPRA